MRARRGIALLTVVLLSALVFITIVGVGYVVVQEKIMVTSEYGFKDALAVAEAGMVQVTVNVQNAYFDGSTWSAPISNEIFTSADIEAIASSTAVRTVTPKVFPAASSSVIRVKAQKTTEGGIVNGTLLDGTVIHVVSMGETYVSPPAATAGASTSTPSETTLIGRRVLEADYQLVKNTTTVPNYAMYAGAQIDFKGNNSHIYGGAIFANGDINLQKKGPRLDTGKIVYSGGTVSNDSGDVVQDSGDGTLPITLIPPTLASMKQLAFEFRTGTGHYTGITAGFPSTVSLKTYLAEFLGAEPTAVGTMQTSTFTGVQNLTADLVLHPVNISTWIDASTSLHSDEERAAAHAEASALLARNAAGDYVNLMKATYYVEVATNDALNQLHAIGTIAVNPLGGELQITGTATIDSGQLPLTPPWWTDNTQTGLSMFIYGDMKGTGSNSDTARVQGQITVTGSFNGKGNFSIAGQLVVSQNITVAGNFYLSSVRSSDGSGEFSTLEFVLKDKTWHEETLGTFTNFN